MFEGLVIMMVIMALVTATVAGFGIWLTFRIVRGILRGLGALVRGSSFDQPPPPVRSCPRATCRASNPSTARFCRRCGQPMNLEQVQGGMQGRVRARARARACGMC